MEPVTLEEIEAEGLEQGWKVEDSPPFLERVDLGSHARRDRSC